MPNIFGQAKLGSGSDQVMVGRKNFEILVSVQIIGHKAKRQLVGQNEDRFGEQSNLLLGNGIACTREEAGNVS